MFRSEIKEPNIETFGNQLISLTQISVETLDIREAALSLPEVNTKHKAGKQTSILVLSWCSPAISKKQLIDSDMLYPGVYTNIH